MTPDTQRPPAGPPGVATKVITDTARRRVRLPECTAPVRPTLASCPQPWKPTLASCPQPWKPFDGYTVALVRRGDVRGEFAAHDGDIGWPALLSSIALRYRNHGRDEGDFLDDVTNPDHRVSEWYRTLRRGRGHRRAEQWLRLRWHRAGTRPPPGRPQLDPETVAGFLCWAAVHHDWKGRAGATDRAMLHAHAKVAVKVGTVEYAASSRQLAEIAHVQHQTAMTATKRLGERKLLALIGRNDKGTNRYRLHVAGHQRTSSASPSGGLTTGSFVTGHDAFRWGALGPNAAAVHAVLTADEATVGQLVEATGVTRRTVRRVLRRLADHRLAIEVEDGRWVHGYATLDDAAVSEGTFGREIFERDRHQAERAVWASRTGPPGLTEPTGPPVRGRRSR